MHKQHHSSITSRPLGLGGLGVRTLRIWGDSMLPSGGRSISIGCRHLRCKAGSLQELGPGCIYGSSSTYQWHAALVL